MAANAPVMVKRHLALADARKIIGRVGARAEATHDEPGKHFFYSGRVSAWFVLEHEGGGLWKVSAYKACPC